MAELAAGRELDALIAEKVMGWLLTRDWAFKQLILTAPDGTQAYSSRGCEWAPTLPAYSTDLTAACSVVEQLRLRHTMLHIHPRVDGYDIAVHLPKSVRNYWGQAPTLALAICRAALAAAEALKTLEEQS